MYSILNDGSLAIHEKERQNIKKRLAKIEQQAHSLNLHQRFRRCKKMGLFDIFRKKRNAQVKRKRHSRNQRPKAKLTIKKIEVGMENVKAQITTINIALKNHDDELSEHTRLISEHSQGLEKLEQRVNTVPLSPPLVREAASTARPLQIIKPSTVPEQAVTSSDHKFEINRFSEQEKRILTVFFHNKGMRLSYADLGRTLNKSPHTIKNQMNRMRLKADLFDRTIGDQSRNRFKLKDDIRIEKYLNMD